MQVNLSAALSALTIDQLRLLLFSSVNDSVVTKENGNGKLRLLFSQSASHKRVLANPKLIEKKFMDVINFCHVSYDGLVADADNLSAILKQQIDEEDCDVYPSSFSEKSTASEMQ